METKQSVITITKKIAYEGDSERAPKGDFYAEQDKFACWDDKIFDGFDVGDEVLVTYTEKKNITPDKTYVNRSITKMVQSGVEQGIQTGDKIVGVDEAIPGAERQIEYIKINDEDETDGKTTMTIDGNHYEITVRRIS